MSKNLILLFILIAAVYYGQKKTNTSETHDLVIQNGRVIDPETMFKGIANAGIKDGKIALNTKSKIKDKKTIDVIGCLDLT